MPPSLKDWTGETRRGVRVLGRVRGSKKDWWCQCLTCNRFVSLKASLFYASSSQAKNCGCAPAACNRLIRLKRGQRFDRLTTMYRRSPEGRQEVWLCQCACGKYKETTAAALAGNRVHSCGCLGGYLSRPQQVNCLFCQKKFTKLRPKQFCCSPLCRQRRLKGYTGPIEKLCDICKKPFIAERSPTKYCSASCRGKFARRRSYRKLVERKALQQMIQLNQLLEKSNVE